MIKRKKLGALLFGCGLLVMSSIYLTGSLKQEKIVEEAKASTVVTAGDFWLTSTNQWDSTAKKNYADLEWESVPDLDSSGYKLFQSEDSTNWELRSTKYGQAISVLNIYPDIYGTYIQSWMSNPAIGLGLINVTPVSMTAFNANPAAYLKDSSGNYKYDVIFVGTSNANNFKAFTDTTVQDVIAFIEAGRGVLVGHDVVTLNPTSYVGSPGPTPNNKLVPYLGLGLFSNPGTNTGYPVSNKVEIKNNGYLMKYPHELQNSLEFTIPVTHSFGQSAGEKYGGTVWLQFKNYTSTLPIFEETGATSNFYLVTKGNGAMIQTGHSNGASTTDEQKIIANTLYNLAQVTLDTTAQDYTVKDDQAPDAPEASIRCGSNNKLNIKLDATDNGKNYQWYVEASTKTNGLLTSDIVEETITSNIAGYFYTLSDSPTSTLQAQVEAKKDSFGRIPESDYDLYVAPDDDAIDYETAAAFTLSEERTAGRYLHVVAVDRSNNVSVASIHELDSLLQYVDFEVERTADEAKLAELKLDAALDSSQQSIEIQIPVNAAIKNFDTLTLPTGWYAFENSATADYRSFTFAIEAANDLATIQPFLENLRFTITSPVNQSGTIRLIFHEKVYTSWIDPAGVTHYYTYVNTGQSWFKAYNDAKHMTYKGLTGYLATLTSEEEHDFMYDNIAKNPGWLGGTRATLTSTGKLHDASSISPLASDYTLTDDEWYWVNGPEAGQVFYKGITRVTGSTVGSMYQAWSSPNEPNNAWKDYSDEYVLQFAHNNSKYWNDLPGNLGWDIDFNNGYYVEFSVYGDQVEGTEITDVCWTAAVPQKVSLKAYDEAGSALPEGDLFFDQTLRIGDTEIITPTEIWMYEFMNLTNLDNTAHPLSYTISDTFQEGKLIYASRKVTVHIRQIITDKNAAMVAPDKGYGQLVSQDAGGTNAQEFSVTMNSSENNTAAFNDYVLRYDKSEVLYTYEPILPEYYELVGYALTTTNQQHLPSGSSTTPISVDVSQNPEFWLTVYLKQSKTAPNLYSWSYKENDLGTIHTP